MFLFFFPILINFYFLFSLKIIVWTFFFLSQILLEHNISSFPLSFQSIPFTDSRTISIKYYARMIKTAVAYPPSKYKSSSRQKSPPFSPYYGVRFQFVQHCEHVNVILSSNEMSESLVITRYSMRSEYSMAG